MNNRSKSMEVPEAKAAMDRFKTEVASELGVNLKEGYNGDLTSREAGSIGGEMVRRMVKQYEEGMKEDILSYKKVQGSQIDCPVFLDVNYFVQLL